VIDPFSSPGSLGLEGILFDEIQEMAEAWHPISRTPLIARTRSPVLQTWEALALQEVVSCPYGHAQDRINAYWRTMIADHACHRAAPKSDWSLFELWHDREDWSRELPDLDEMASYSLRRLASALDDVVHQEERMFDALLDLGLSGPSILSSKKRYGEYMRRIHKACGHRALFVTMKGYIGLAAWNARVGDSVCVLKGGRTPFLLRSMPLVGEWTLIVETYVYGIMASEAFYWDGAHAAMQIFNLV
jgi:hypothetical protein